MEKQIKEVGHIVSNLVRVCFMNPNPLNVEIKINEAIADIQTIFQGHIETLLSRKSEIEEHIPSNISNPEVTSPKPKKKK